MATFNIADRGVTTNSISVRAYYGGTASDRNALYVNFYCDGSYFATESNAGSKNWTTGDKTKTGLTPNYLYSFYAIFYDSGYNEIGRTQTISIRTDSIGEPTPLPPSSVSVSSITSNSVTVSHGTVSGANAYMLYREVNGMDIHIDTHVHPNSTFYVTGLMANTTYRMGVSSVNTNGESSIRWSSYFTTLSSDTTPPILNITNLQTIKLPNGTYNLAVAWTASDNVGLSYFELYVSAKNSNTMYWKRNLDSYERSSTITSDGNGLAFQLNGTYKVQIIAYDTSGNSTSKTSTISIISERPENWVWGSQYNIYSGGAFFRQSNRTAYLMDATHWNGFTVRINEFRRYKGVTDYVFTPVSSEMNVTATIINQAINAINGLGFSMPTLTSGVSNVSASIFNDMVNNLKSIV